MSIRKLVVTAGIAITIAFTTAPPVRADDAQKSKIDWSAKLAVPITHDVRDACESANASDQAYCFGLIMADYDANFYLADALASEPLCIPKTATPADLRQAFIDQTKARPDQLLGPFAIFFYLSMSSKYPCAPGIRSTPGPTHGLNPGNNTK